MVRGERGAALRLRRLSIENVRCWSSCQLALTYLDDSPLDQAVLFGDSGSGKSALLSAVAQICELDEERLLPEPYSPRLIRSGQITAQIELALQLGPATLVASLSLRGTDSPWLRPVTQVRQSPAAPHLAWPPRGRIAYVGQRPGFDLRQKLLQLRWRSQRLGRDEAGRPPLHPGLQRLGELFQQLDPHHRSLVHLSDSDEPWLLATEVPARLLDLASLTALASERNTTALPASCVSESERTILDLAAQLTLREVVPEIVLLDEPVPGLSEERRASIIPAVRKTLPGAQVVVATASRAILHSVHDYERLPLPSKL